MRTNHNWTHNTYYTRSVAFCSKTTSTPILYWNSVKIEKIINQLKKQGEEINDEVLAHISLLPYKHVLPQGTYFVENK
jgi:hypothetical protein